MGFPGRGAGLGLGGVALLLVLSVLTGQDFLTPVLQQSASFDSEAPSSDQGEPYESSPEEERLVDFVSFVLDDAQGVWHRELPRLGREYRDAKLVLFTDAVRSGCGFAESAMGPFYCPADEKVYVDLGFYRELRSRFGAPGDFAQAYVLAHEVGHHVQNVLGIAEKVHRAQQGNPDRAGPLSIRMELQADCLAGIWAHSTEKRELLEAGDAEEGIAAAAAVGDDRIQKQATGRVNPESWTHGSSKQRVAWFMRGFRSESLGNCDTFNQQIPEDLQR